MTEQLVKVTIKVKRFNDARLYMLADDFKRHYGCAQGQEREEHQF